MDEIVITGANEASIIQLKSLLNQQFKLKDLGELKYFLGIELARSSQEVCLSQRHYTWQLLEETGLLGSKPEVVPIDPTLKPGKNSSQPLKDPSSYRRLIRKLLYLTITRPGISFTVNKLSQFVSQHCQNHLSAAHHLVKYLKNTPGQGIISRPITSFELKAFADSDWASCIDT